MEKIEAKQYVEFTYEGVTEKFYEGDKVVCRTDDKEYTGTVKAIGIFRETEDSEPVTVICIDTSKSAWSYSSEIIKVDDVAFICKDFLADADIDNSMTDEEMKKNTYISLFVGMGYDRTKVEDMWTNVDKLMKQFDLPFEKVMSCMIYSLKYECGLETPLKLICGIDVAGMQNDIVKFEQEAAKCLGLALVGGIFYAIGSCLEAIDKDN